MERGGLRKADTYLRSSGKQMGPGTQPHLFHLWKKSCSHWAGVRTKGRGLEAGFLLTGTLSALGRSVHI